MANVHCIYSLYPMDGGCEHQFIDGCIPDKLYKLSYTCVSECHIHVIRVITYNPYSLNNRIQVYQKLLWCVYEHVFLYRGVHFM